MEYEIKKLSYIGGENAPLYAGLEECIDVSHGKRGTISNLERAFTEYPEKFWDTDGVVLSKELFATFLDMGIVDHNRFEPVYMFKPL